MKDVMELQINSNTLDTSYSNIRNERRIINYVTAFIRESYEEYERNFGIG